MFRKTYILLILAVFILIGLSCQPAAQNNNSAPDTADKPESQNQHSDSMSVKAAVLHTNMGQIKIELYPQVAPITVDNFAKLAEQGYYDQTKFHRVITDFMIQGGDPNSKDDDWSDDGQGGPGYYIQDEINQYKLRRGNLAMANIGRPNTNGSQFFIVTAGSTPWLDGKHTVFGRVVEGMEVVDKIEALPVDQKDHPTADAIIENITIIK